MDCNRARHDEHCADLHWTEPKPETNTMNTATRNALVREAKRLARTRADHLLDSGLWNADLDAGIDLVATALALGDETAAQDIAGAGRLGPDALWLARNRR